MYGNNVMVCKVILGNCGSPVGRIPLNLEIRIRSRIFLKVESVLETKNMTLNRFMLTNKFKEGPVDR